MQQCSTTPIASRSYEAVVLGLSFFRANLTTMFRASAIALLAAFSLGASQFANAVSCSNTQNGLVALYPKGSLGADYAGWNYGFNNAKLVGNPANTSDSSFGNVLQLNGSGQFVQLPSAFLQDLGTYGISIWFKATSSGGVLLGMQNSPYGSAPSVSESLLYVGTDGKLYVAVNIGYGVSPYAVGTVNDGNWHHVFMDVTSTTTDIYVDGSWKVQFGPTPVGQSGPPYIQWITYTSSVSYSQIGTGYTTASHTATPGGWFSFNGEIGEVAIFNRTFPFDGTFHNSEITDIINNGATGICVPTQESITTNALTVGVGDLTSLGLSYIVAPDASPSFTTSPSCYSSANGGSQPSPAFYDNAIFCSGAVATGDAFTYQSNMLTLGSPTAGSNPLVEPDAYVGQPYSQSVSIPNVPGGSNYSLTGTPPPGLAININSGVLSGTPTQAGEYNSFNAHWSTEARPSGADQPARLRVLPAYGDLIVAAADSQYQNSSIYRVNPNTGAKRLIASIPGDAIEDVAVDPNTGIIYAVSNSAKIYAISSAGTVTTLFSNAAFQPTYAIAVDNNSNIYFASMSQVYKLNSSGQLLSVQGNQINGPMMPNPFNGQNQNAPRMIFDRDGNLLISGDVGGVPEVSSTVLSGAQFFTTYVYTATSAGNAPGNIQGMAFARDGSGDLILADAKNNLLLRISQLHGANLASKLITNLPSLVGVVAGNVVPFNEYYVGEGTGFGTFKVVPQTSVSVPLANYSETHQMAITWFRYNATKITIQTPSTTSFTLNTAYNFGLQATGGNGNYEWSATGLPPGLTLSERGILSGTPTCTGSYSVALQVEDSAENEATGNFTFTVIQNLQPLTIAASNQTMTYGGTLPTPNFTTSVGNVSFTTQPTCSYRGLPSPLNAGTYTGAIVCGDAAASGFSISYVPGNLVVNPAPLTVTANSFVINYGDPIPAFTFQISGLVNGDAVTGSPAFATNIPSGDPAGMYSISVTQNTLTASANYTLSNFLPGTLTINPVQQTPTLSLQNNFILSGDYYAQGLDNGLTASATQGYVQGTITIPPSALPAGAEVVATYLYWQALETAAMPSSSFATFNGYSIFGTPIGGDLTVGCWTSAAPGGIMRAYRSNVTAFLPVVNGSNNPVGTQNVLLPQSPYGTSASLVVIYRSLDPSVPLGATVLYDGNWSQEYPPGYTPTFNLNLTGFFDSTGAGRMTDITSLMNTSGGFSFAPQTQTTTVNLPDQSGSIAMPNNFAGLQSGQCRVWTATVLSTPVHSSSNDNLIDSWKTAQGYTDPVSNTWVALPNAQVGQRDLFVQIDYMVGADGHSHQPSQNALNMVQNAFAQHGVNAHFVLGNAIPEQTCTNTTPPATDEFGNPLYCVFPGEPGVVAWKVGVEDLKTEVVNANACSTYDPANAACQPRFPYGRRNSYHYALFGHSLGIANWSVNDGTLTSISVSGGVATVNLSVPLTTCPSTVSITNAFVTVALNGTYTVTGCQPSAAPYTSFTVNTTGVPDGTYPSPGALPEPALAIVNGNTGSISGYSDVGGSDSVITLGKWGTDGTRDNVVAGTLMHELGHTLGLTHGGSYSGYGTQSVYGANCKPNYQSIMNYLFQIDGLGPDAAIDYSSENLSNLDKSQLGTQILGLSTTSNAPPKYSTTSWYSPIPPFDAGTPASRRCDGSLPNGETEFLITGAAAPVAWTTGQDINFDGMSSEILQGYNDWLYVNFNQIGATGSEILPYPLGLADGGKQLTGGGGKQLTGGGGKQLTGGGGIQLSGGGGIQRTGGGGIQLSGGGGIQLSGGGGIQRTGGGGIQLAGGGGIQLSGGGGKQLAGGGGKQLTGGGGVDAEILFETANAVVRPPRAAVTNGNTITWSAPLFGNVTGYNIYCSVNGSAPALIATLSPPPTPLTYTNGTIAGNNCTVTTIVTDPGGTQRESTAPNPPTTRQNQTIMFANPGTLPYSTLGYALMATATSGLPVSFAATGTCTVTGSTLFTTSPGNCVVTASQAGSAFAAPATNVVQSFMIVSATQAPLVLGVTPTTLTYNTNAAVTVTGGTINGAITYSINGPCSISGTQLKANSGTGSCTITATMAGNADYNSVASNLVTVNLQGAGQTITFAPLANRLFSTATFNVSATASSGLAINWSASGGNCSVVATGVVTMTHYGVCTITASQPGNANYAAATSVSQSFTIGQWTIVGFASPIIDTAPGATITWNSVKAGKKVPMEFNVYAGTVQQTSVSAVKGQTIEIDFVTCKTGADIFDDDIDLDDEAPLRWDGTEFLQNWKTLPIPGICYSATATTLDGSAITAYFKTH